ncbi:flagellin [Franconibacter helveticus]|uniref:flagellin N-terminal helical domain-containing protein n=1 Tax=Franconibacter helveticus TaxID=357240 RepID=UPI000DA159C7|nr:flagellin [Franconibacter helveticus]
MTTLYSLMSPFTATRQRNSESVLSQAITRLSSGMRINGASDDAAGQAIANRMTATINANGAVARNIDDGVSLMQTAEGGLDEINNLLIRARTLAVQAANGTLSPEDRAALQNEFHAISENIDQIAYGTTVFGKYPLAAASHPAPAPVQLGKVPSIDQRLPVAGQGYVFTSGLVPFAYIPAGAKDIVLEIDSGWMDDDMQIFTRDGSHLVGTPVNGNGAVRDFTWRSNGINNSVDASAKILTEENGFIAQATYQDANLVQGGAAYDINGSVSKTLNGMTITYSGDGDRYETPATGWANNGTVSPGHYKERITIDNVSEDLIVMVPGTGSFTGSMTWSALPTPTQAPDTRPTSSDTEIVVSADFGQALETKTIPATPADSVTLGVHDLRLDSQDNARQAMDKLDAALEKVNGYRSTYGGLNNAFASAKAVVMEGNVATGAARSRIEDADYAREVSNMTRAQILQQAGNALMAQGRQAPENILSLLKG